MKKLLIDKALPEALNAFPAPFLVENFENKPSEEQLNQNDILVCRSTLEVNQSLLEHSSIQVVATATSGTNHLDIEWLNANHITWFDAKGCNAVSVSDYTLSCIAWFEQKQLLGGKKVAIIGLGHVGKENLARLSSLGFQCLIYDPPRQAQEAHFQSHQLKEIYQADIVLLNCNYHQDEPFGTHHLVNYQFLDNLKPNVAIINTSRGEIVDESAIIANAHKIHYLTDVYQNEPNINADIVEMASICTPHIAGHSRDAKYKAVQIVSKKIHSLFKLTLPHYHSAPFLDVVVPPRKGLSWQHTYLTYYNPHQETMILKDSHNIAETFKELRVSHRIRHDFERYQIK